MDTQKMLSRRRFLQVSGLATSAALLAACPRARSCSRGRHW